jgi:D-alanyl-D-alanine carboxypeptidase (penicillin-binding protein 5/6)
MRMISRLAILLAALIWQTSAWAAVVETPATQAIMIDHRTKSVLFEKNADERMPPSSMAKLMTIYMLFERLADGRLKMGDRFEISEKAWKMGGSKMFVEVGKKVRVEDLIRGVIVQSGNDACVVIAEGIAGTEEAFAELMNEKARQIGMTGSHFTNSSGWPDPDQYVTARDLSVLAIRLIDDFPQFYKMFSEKTFTYSGIRQGNRNPLLYKRVGADGLKTGHTEAAGFGLVASAERDGTRLVLVVNGLDSVNQRSRESERLMNFGFREFGSYALFKGGEVVDRAAVWLGDEDDVPLVIEKPLDIMLARKSRRQLKVSMHYTGPIPAPVEKGDTVGYLRVEAPDIDPLKVPLVAGADVPRLGVFGRLGAAVRHLVFGGADS